MTADTRRTCGTCGARTRYIGSHAMYEHAAYVATPEEIRTAIQIARSPFVARALANALPAKEL